MSRREGTLGVIVPSAWVQRADEELAGLGHGVLGRTARDPDAVTRIEIVDAQLAKGLEFDHVLLLEPAQLVAAEPERVIGLRRLYVCLTRAVTSLTVLHGQPLPDELSYIGAETIPEPGSPRARRGAGGSSPGDR